jgi:hypothetical protein
MAGNIQIFKPGLRDVSDHIAKTGAKVMVTGDTLFKSIGDVLITAIFSECYTANNATASTLQYSVTNDATATSQTISGVSASLASAAIGVSVIPALGALTNVPVVSNAAGVGAFPWGAIRVAGSSSIKSIVGVGSTTGTWKHYIRWEPLEDGAILVPQF